MAPMNSTLDNVNEAQQALSRPTDCPDGVYTFPSLNAVVDPSQNLTVQWDSTCFADETSMQLDLYRDLSLVHEWDVSNSSNGQLTVTLDPTWWANATNANTNTTFYFSITPNFPEDGQSPLQLFPQGPIFTVANSTAAALPSGGIQGALSHLSQTQLIAAIATPILTIIVLASVIFVIMRSRAETARQRREWMEGIRPVSRY